MSLIVLLQVLFSAILQEYFDDCIVVIANQKIQWNETDNSQTFDLFTLQNLTSDYISMYYFTDAVYFNEINPSDRCLNYIIYHSNIVQTFKDLEVFVYNDSYSRYNTRKYLIIAHTEKEVEEIFASSFVRVIPNFVVASIAIQNIKFDRVKFYYQPL